MVETEDMFAGVYMLAAFAVACLAWRNALNLVSVFEIDHAT
jgi:hypothetical protein